MIQVLLLILSVLAVQQANAQIRAAPGPILVRGAEFPSAKVTSMSDGTMVAVTGIIEAFVGKSFQVEVDLEDPNADFIKIEVDERAYGNHFLEIGKDMFGRSTAQPLNGYRLDPVTHKLRIKIGAAFVGVGMTTGPFPFLLKLTSVKAGIPDRSVSRNLGDIKVVQMKKFVITETYPIAQKMGFVRYRTFSLDPYPRVCEGTSVGAAGSFAVGMTDTGGDLAFNIRSGPIGTICSWDASSKLRIDYAWKIKGFTFTHAKTSKCDLGGDDFRAPPTPGTLRHDLIQFGKFNRVTLANLSQPEDRFPIVSFPLSCDNTLSNDHFVSVRWTSIELEGPDDETADMAFNGRFRQ